LLRFTGCPSPRFPLDDARSTPQNRALVTSGNGLAASTAGFRYAESGITEVIPHPVLCRMVCDLGRFDWAPGFPDAA
jgi:hypothetical protein